MVTASSDKSVRIWNIDTGELCGIFYCVGAAMSLETIDNNTLAVGDSNGMLYVLEIGGSMYSIHNL